MVRHRSLAAILAALTLGIPALAPAPVHAQATLVTGLGGPAGYGDTSSCLSRNDDGSSRSVDIRAAFPTGLRFFGGTYTTLFVNTNGNITFNRALPAYTANPFPVASQPMIAPFWADVDIRRADSTPDSTLDGADGGGDGSLTCAGQPNADDMVWWSLAPGRIVVTWDRVGYYKRHKDHRMAFQLVLTAATPDPVCGGAPGADTNFDVEFRFNRCEWEVGDASGGAGGFATRICPPAFPPLTMGGCTEAQSGFDAGNSRDFVMIPGSRDPGIARKLCMESNVGDRGVWRFSVRDGVVLCPDAGDPCTVPGARGVCAEGRTQCVGGGTSCVPLAGAGPERCDALDNDCNGAVDDVAGGGIARLDCGTLQVCDTGVCTDGCFEGGCPSGFSCNAASGLCVEEACASVRCTAGQRCRGGACVGACDGVTCPLGQECRAGRCAPRCAGIVCDGDAVCEEGACQTRCPCRPCDTGETCEPDGRCVASACAGVSCALGTSCVDGACVDACTGAVCPAGQRCAGGACIDAERPDAGAPMPGFDGGFVTPGEDGGSSVSDQDAGGAEEADGGRRRTRASTSCGCRAVGASHPRSGASILALVFGCVALRRARRRTR